MTDLVLILMAGGAFGWLAIFMIRTSGLRAILPDILTGVVGAMIAGFLGVPLLDRDVAGRGVDRHSLVIARDFALIPMLGFTALAPGATG
jgi:uncharacterized membrane protein YeaQ/YmgE (transglycosylase-associated protein family)